MPARDLLVIDAGRQSLQALTHRLRRMGFRALLVKTPEAAHDTLLDDRYAIRAVLIPTDLPATSLGGALDALVEVSAEGRLHFVAAGPGASETERGRLRDAGVRFTLLEPLDGHSLRFLMNRVTAPEEIVVTERGATRAPANWPVQVRTAGREKPAQVYTISPNGAYLATERPSLRDALVHLALPLPEGRIAAAARVVMTNVPGNLSKRNLPLGMGVRFTGASSEVRDSIERFVAERLREMEL